jgi:hypothetical protein
MRLLLLLLVVGCHPSDMDYPVGGGGTHGGGGTLSIDASIDGTGSGSDIMATACVLTDARDLTSCTTAGAAGLAVTLGTAAAITAADGSFTIARPVTTPVVWDVTGSTVVESVTPFAGQTRIPVMEGAMLADLQSSNGVQPSTGTGTLMARISRGGAPVQGVAALVSPATTDPNGSLYDPATASAQWSSIATGSFGTVYVPGAITGTASLTLSAGGTTQGTVSGIPITDGGVTFVFVALP